jgi:hypothetical protein
MKIPSTKLDMKIPAPYFIKKWLYCRSIARVKTKPSRVRCLEIWVSAEPRECGCAVAYTLFARVRRAKTGACSHCVGAR